jgi:hypothetical protein
MTVDLSLNMHPLISCEKGSDEEGEVFFLLLQQAMFIHLVRQRNRIFFFYNIFFFNC